MQDSNPAAVAALQQGAQFLGTTPLRQAQTGELQSEIQSQGVQRQLMKQQIAQQQVATEQAKRANFLQNQDPHSWVQQWNKHPIDPNANDDYSNQARAFLKQNGMSGPGFFNDQDQYVDLSKGIVPWEQLGPDNQRMVIGEYQRRGEQNGYQVSPAEAMAAYRDQYYGSMPPINIWTGQKYGMSPVTMETGPQGPTTKWVSDQAAGGAGGQTAGGQKPFIMVGGEFKTNPDYPTAEQQKSNANDLAGLQNDVTTIGQLRRIANDPNAGIVGPGLFEGREPGKALRAVGSAVGLAKDSYAKERELLQNLTAQVTRSAKSMGGRVGAQELQFLQGTTPKQSDPPAVWNQWINKWEDLVNRSIYAIQSQTPVGMLPPVGVMPSVSAPESGGSRAEGSESPGSPGNENLGTNVQKFPSEQAAIAANLPSGTVALVKDPTGKWRRWTPPTQ